MNWMRELKRLALGGIILAAIGFFIAGLSYPAIYEIVGWILSVVLLVFGAWILGAIVISSDDGDI